MNEFSIIQKHYDTIIKQGYDNLPYEAGGFFGGTSEGVIMAILPVFNQHDDGRKDNFVFTSDMLIRAHEFFKKHDLIYYGLYHTHPTGVAYPSDADISSGQRFHFIISYQNRNIPVLNAFEIINNKPHQISIKVISDKGFSSLDKNAVKKKKNRFSPQQSPNEDRDDLEERIANIITEQPNKYRKIEPREDVKGSDFSTMA